MGKGQPTSRHPDSYTELEVLLEAKNERIAELEAEVRELNALLEKSQDARKELDTHCCKRIEELERQKENIQLVRDDLRRRHTALVDGLRRLPSYEFHERQFPYSSLGLWVRLDDVITLLGDEE